MLDTNQIDTFGQKAAEAAMRGAANYIKVHGLMNEVDLGRVTELIGIEVKAILPQALADVKEALDANMGEVAAQTFMASMVIAGINAVKAYQTT
jgi:hypothetical protein